MPEPELGAAMSRPAASTRIAGVFAAIGLCLALTQAHAAGTITPKAALRAIVAAGYSGAGGVTLSGNYYFSTALTSKGKKVRISVDSHSGVIAAVEPVRRGSGSLTPQPRAARGYQSPTINAVMPPLMFDPYVPPDDTKPIGAPYTPFTRSGRPVPPLCQYNPNGPGC